MKQWFLWLWEFRHLPKFLWYKYWVHRNTFGPWMRWSLDKETREALLKNGWHDPAHITAVDKGPPSFEDFQ